jgi:hypothetical protein
MKNKVPKGLVVRGESDEAPETLAGIDSRDFKNTSV